MPLNHKHCSVENFICAFPFGYKYCFESKYDQLSWFNSFFHHAVASVVTFKFQSYLYIQKNK